MSTHNQRLVGIVVTVALLLSIPLVAMQFSGDITWTFFDFVVAGILLLSTGLAIELVLRKIHRIRDRVIICGVFLVILAFVWVELAVGIFGTPFAGN